MRSREFTSPLVARCALGVCKRGCADACVEFFWVVILWGLASCWKVRSREFMFRSNLLLSQGNGMGKGKEKGEKSGS